MFQVSDSCLNTSKFNFQMKRDGIAQVSLGPIELCMTLDSIYELQYGLAAFLANLELNDFPIELDNEEQGLTESRQALEALTSHLKLVKLDA